MFNAMIGEILIGFGIVCQYIGWATGSWLSYYLWIGMILTTGAAGVYIWAVLKYNDFVEEHIMGTAYRAWRVNFIMFWVTIGVAIVNIGLGYANYSNFSVASSTLGTGITMNRFGALIAAIIGAVAIGVGIYFAWFIKNLWFLLDAAGSLDLQPFDYTKWTDRLLNPKSILKSKSHKDTNHKSSSSSGVNNLLANVQAIMF